MSETVQLVGRSIDDDYIDLRGISVDWYQSMFCPCYDIRSGQPNFNCTTCYGTGRLYLEPKTIKTLITNVKQDKNYSIVGVWELGTCRCTPKAEINIGVLDRIIFKNLILTFSEIINRSERPELINKDLLRFYSIVNIIRVQTLTTIYTPEIDYKIIKDNNNAFIEWQTGGQKPASGQQYSIIYEHRPEWISWDIPQVRSDSDEHQMPKFVVLRRKDLVTSKPTQ